MANLIVLYWRDIPAQVIVRAGRSSAKRELSKRFIEAIDRAAMKGGLAGTEAYLEQWRRADPQPCGDDLDAEAAKAAAALETLFDAERLRRLSDAGGRSA